MKGGRRCVKGAGLSLNVKYFFQWRLLTNWEGRARLMFSLTLDISLPSFLPPYPSELITARFNVEECLYATAVCLYSQGEWQGARDKVDRLLRLNPDHRYGNELHLYVKDAQGMEGRKGGRGGRAGEKEGKEGTTGRKHVGEQILFTIDINCI